jgi:phosphoglycolate phosphatase-like HAD superfamily hydrolase
MSSDLRPLTPGPDLVAFDLDGVLYSSEPFLGAAYREAIANVNAALPGSFASVPTTREILDHIGWPVPVILQRLFPSIEEAAMRRLHSETLHVICGHVARGDGILYPDVASTLHGLREAGFQLAVASNGRTRYVETVLATYALGDLFIPRVTADMVGDKTSVLRFYCYRLGVEGDAVVMVGDRASDVEAARAVGCRFVGCDYEHGYRHEIEAAGPLVSHFTDLTAFTTALAAPRQLVDGRDSPSG